MMTLFHNDALGKLILRLTVGGLLLFHGVAKILHPNSIDFISARLAEYGVPGVMAYAVYVGEVLAPLMLIAGIYSRYAAALVAINMLFAIGLVHTADVFALSEHGGLRLELQDFYLFSAIAIIFLGSGNLAMNPD